MIANLLNQYIFHWSPDKAVFIGGHSLLWDARCSGIYIGLGVGLIWHLFVARKAKYLPRFSILLVNTSMFLPMVADLLSIGLNLRNPSNEIRLLTGIFFGGSFIVYLYPAFISLFVSKNESRSAINSISAYISYLSLSLIVFFTKEINNVFTFIFLYTISLIGFGGLIFIFLSIISKGLLVSVALCLKK